MIRNFPPAGRLLITGAALACLATLAACGKTTLDFRNAEIVHGKLYSMGADSPFSGRLTNIPVATLTSSRRGFAKVINVISFAAPYATIAGTGLNTFCDVPVSDGLPDGKAVCKAADSDNVRVEMTFREGVLEGPFHLNDDSGRNTFSETGFQNGEPDGVQKVFDAPTGKLGLSVPWSHGVMTGTEEMYNVKSGQKVLEIHRNDEGKLDGEYAEWTRDGTLAHRLTYTNGKKEGIEETFYPETGKLASHLEWKDGRQNGLTQTYNRDGTVASTLHFENGKQVYTTDEVQALAQHAASDAFDHCMKSVMLGELSGLTSHAEYEARGRAGCEAQAQAVSQAKQQNPGSNGLVATMPAASSSVTSDTSSFISPAASSPAASPTTLSSDGPAAKRCGWVENSLPGGELALTDRDGRWSIVSADNKSAGFPEHMPSTERGDTCACLTVETNRKAMGITRILRGEIIPVSTCQRDASLH